MLFNMKPDQLISEQKRIETRIKTLGRNPYPIRDGVLNPMRYSTSNPKILWVLQEAYDRKGNDWKMSELIDRFVKDKGFGKTWQTWEMILYVSWSILNPQNDKLLRWNEMPDHSEKPELIETLYNIAFINVKKSPNTVDSRSREPEIRKAYKQNKEILLDQISTYDPDIIIFGNTMTYFYNDLGIKQDKIVIHSTNTNYLINNKCLYIDVYHPAYKKGLKQREAYCDEIVEVIERCDFTRTKKR